ncbi:YbaB/EbfC family nucleoid-associated protein [Sciscionella sediminilitoris]|uniref:YbaB/EbfC family nucleoid-associated protein n=1 Tax=Sciscionella sediminilitoris TaxID=1445613 RepID=UPI00068E500C|nr:YbaB/EbfC family nucleoid-associated protein [Sciscionella sp. SE31]
MTSSEEAQQRYDSLVATGEAAERDFEKLQQIQQELQNLEVTETSADRSVSVTAGATGTIKAINITEAGLSKGAAGLSSTVLNTLHQAVSKATQRQLEMIREGTTHNPALQKSIDDLHEELAHPPEEEQEQERGRPAELSFGPAEDPEPEPEPQKPAFAPEPPRPAPRPSAQPGPAARGQHRRDEVDDDDSFEFKLDRGKW